MKGLHNMNLGIDCTLQVLRLGFKLKRLALRVEGEASVRLCVALDFSKATGALLPRNEAKSVPLINRDTEINQSFRRLGVAFDSDTWQERR